MSDIALRLLDRPVPPAIAARMLQCDEALFGRVPVDQLTLGKAFRLALRAALLDRSDAQLRRKTLKSRRKSKIVALKRVAHAGRPSTSWSKKG